MTIHPGLRIRDNDPRMRNRVLTIEAIIGDYAMLTPAADRNTPYIALRRIHTDGKPRRSGWSVVAMPKTPCARGQDGSE